MRKRITIYVGWAVGLLLFAGLATPRGAQALYGSARSSGASSSRARAQIALAPISHRARVKKTLGLSLLDQHQYGQWIIKRGDSTRKEVMLTFDDGPHPRYTPEILAVLRRYNIRATFFVVGKMARKYPQLVKEMAAEGHLVANHTYDHVRLTGISESQDSTELQECSDVIQSIIGKAPEFCRPPGCSCNSQVMDAASRLNLKVVFYSLNTLDTIDHNKSSLAARVLRCARNGSIILCHDGFQHTVDALPHIITGLQKKGFAFETLAHDE